MIKTFATLVNLQSFENEPITEENGFVYQSDSFQIFSVNNVDDFFELDQIHSFEGVIGHSNITEESFDDGLYEWCKNNKFAIVKDITLDFFPEVHEFFRKDGFIPENDLDNILRIIQEYIDNPPVPESSTSSSGSESSASESSVSSGSESSGSESVSSSGSEFSSTEYFDSESSESSDFVSSGFESKNDPESESSKNEDSYSDSDSDSDSSNSEPSDY